MAPADIQVAVRRRDVHDAGAIFERYRLVGDNCVRVRHVGRIALRGYACKQVFIVCAGQISPFHHLEHFGLAAENVVQARLRQHVVLMIRACQHIIGVALERERDIGRQRPRRGRPGEQVRASQQTVLDLELHPQRRVFDVVLIAQRNLMVGERGRAA